MSHESTPRNVQLESLSLADGSGWRRLPALAVVVGVGGTLVAAVAAGSGRQFYSSWLVATLFCLSIGLGCLFFVLVHHATKAGWGVVVRRLAENGAACVPLAALLVAVALVFGLHDLFHWSHAEAMAHDQLLAGKRRFLNASSFWWRAGLYFVAWTVLAGFFYSRSRTQDRSGDHALSASMIRYSGPALVLFALSVTFASFDWIMSIDPHWYSTIFGVYFFAGCVVSGFAFLSVVAVALRRTGYLREAVTAEHFHDLGKLLFAFTVFWAYIAFSQFLLIWYGNIPEETEWFLGRLEGSWRIATMVLAWGHFVIPFFFLMPRTVKRRPGVLALGALWMLAMHYLDLYWLVMPVFAPAGVMVSPVDVAALVGAGGIFLAAFFWFLARGALVPVRDPRLQESLGFENF